VQFVIRHDRKQYFRFTSLQSQTGQTLLQDQQLPTQEWGSFILWDRGKIYTKSTAVLRVTKKLSGLWPLFSVFLIIPPFIRDAVYDLVARNRYRWFGKKESCWIPTPELDRLFPDQS
jgi:predicted DCC family thiol-disulfide oxidoreductase YuxK